MSQKNNTRYWVIFEIIPVNPIDPRRELRELCRVVEVFDNETDARTVFQALNDVNMYHNAYRIHETVVPLQKWEYTPKEICTQNDCLLIVSCFGTGTMCPVERIEDFCKGCPLENKHGKE